MGHETYDFRGPRTYRIIDNSRLLFGIVHFSDFHLKNETDFDTNTILYRLVLDARERINILGLDPVYIVITGDLTYSGKRREFEDAKKFIKLIKEYIDPADIFVAPGNHDVDRDSLRQLAQDIMERIAEQGVPGIQEASKVFNNDQERLDLIQGMGNYYDFIRSIYGAPPKPDYLYRIKTINKEPYIVNFISLNSAYLWSKKYSFFGYLGMDQLKKAFTEAENNSRDSQGKEINVAFFHHPFEALPDVTRVETQNYLLAMSDLILTGHVHTPHLFTEYTAQMTGRKRSVDPPVIASARCVYDPQFDSNITPGYYLIGIYADNAQVEEIRVWEVKYDSGAWYVDQNHPNYPIEIRMRLYHSQYISNKLPPGWKYQKVDYESFYGKKAVYKLKFKNKEQIDLPFYVFFLPERPLPMETVEFTRTKNYWEPPRTMKPPFDRRKKELLNLYVNYYKHPEYDQSLASANSIRWDEAAYKLRVLFKQCNSTDALLSDLECDIHFTGWTETSRDILRTSLDSNSWHIATGSIGVSALVETRDGKVIVQRKKTFEEEQEWGKIPYVHALGGKYAPSSSGGMKYYDENAFTAIYRELEEELYLLNGREEVEQPSLMGVTKSVEWNNRPEFHFITKTNLEEQDIRERNPRDAFEYRNLIFVRRDDKETFYNILSDKETRAARKATFVLYIYFFHQDWLETP